MRLMLRLGILAVVLFITGFTIWNNAQQNDSSPPKVGDQAPDFTLQTLDGKTVSLSDYKGKGIFLNFWGTWCPPCRAEMPAFEKQYEAKKDQGFVILAVNMGESKASVQGFVNEFGLTFPILMDPNGQVAVQYGIDPLPTTMIINPDGKITKIFAGGITEDMVKYHANAVLPK